MTQMQTWTQNNPYWKQCIDPQEEVPQGPWNDEPDKAQWVDEDTDLDCLIVRGPMGALCGYVGVPETHPWFGKGYSECTVGCGADWCEHTPEVLAEVHGGLTFSAACHESEEGPEYGICHVPLPGRTDKVWWFGFDCGHAWDLIPIMAAKQWHLSREDTYKNFSYVQTEVASLAKQVAAATTPEEGR